MKFARSVDEIDYNYHHAMGGMAAASKLGEMLAAGDRFIVNNGFPVPDLNLAFPRRGTYKLDRTLNRIETYFESAALPFRVVVGDHECAAMAPALEARGYAEKLRLPGLVLEPIVTNAGPDRLRILDVTDPDTLLGFGRSAFAAFGFPVEAASVTMTDALFEHPNLAAFAGYVDGELVSTSLLFVTGTTAGIYWVGTLDGHRGRGYGEAMTAHAAREGMRRGCRLASLQASEMGRPVYERMGFRLVRDYVCFERPPAREGDVDE